MPFWNAYTCPTLIVVILIWYIRLGWIWIRITILNAWNIISPICVPQITTFDMNEGMHYGMWNPIFMVYKFAITRRYFGFLTTSIYVPPKHFIDNNFNLNTWVTTTYTYVSICVSEVCGSMFSNVLWLQFFSFSMMQFHL